MLSCSTLLAHYYGKRLCQPSYWSTSDSCLTSLTPRPMIVVFGLEMRVYVCMHTNFENGILCTSSPHFALKQVLAAIHMHNVTMVVTLGTIISYIPIFPRFLPTLKLILHYSASAAKQN